MNHLTNSLHILLVLSLAIANNYTALSWHRTITNKVQERHCTSNNLLYCTQTANISKTKLTKILTFSKAPSRRHSFRCRANFSTNYQHNTQHIHTHLTALFPGLPRWAGTRKVQEAQLSLRDHAMRRVNWNLANCHATVQKLLIRQVLTKSMVWSWRFSRRQCVIDNVHSTMTRLSRLPLSQAS